MRAKRAWMGESRSAEVSLQPCSEFILQLLHSGTKHTIDASLDFLKMSGTFSTFFSEALNIRPTISQIVITDTDKAHCRVSHEDHFCKGQAAAAAYHNDPLL